MGAGAANYSTILAHNGVYSRTYDTSQTSSWNPAFLSTWGGSTAFAEAAFETGLLNSGIAYFNIHTSYAPAGEVRGFYEPAPAAAVPEPEGIGDAGDRAASAADAGTQALEEIDQVDDL